jgi:hypothetical protein
MIPTFTIDLDKKCAECRKEGAAPSGICLACTVKAVSGRPMKTAIGRAVAARFRENAARPRQKP